MYYIYVLLTVMLLVNGVYFVSIGSAQKSVYDKLFGAMLLAFFVLMLPNALTK